MDGLTLLKEVWPEFEKIVNDALMFKQVHGDYISKESSEVFKKLRLALKELGVRE